MRRSAREERAGRRQRPARFFLPPLPSLCQRSLPLSTPRTRNRHQTVGAHQGGVRALLALPRSAPAKGGGPEEENGAAQAKRSRSGGKKKGEKKLRLQKVHSGAALPPLSASRCPLRRMCAQWLRPRRHWAASAKEAPRDGPVIGGKGVFASSAVTCVSSLSFLPLAPSHVLFAFLPATMARSLAVVLVAIALASSAAAQTCNIVNGKARAWWEKGKKGTCAMAVSRARASLSPSRSAERCHWRAIRSSPRLVARSWTDRLGRTPFRAGPVQWRPALSPAGVAWLPAWKTPEGLLPASCPCRHKSVNRLARTPHRSGL